jgi:hypothetical protein
MMMNHYPKAVTIPIVLSLALAGGNAAAESISAEQIYADLPAEVAQDGQQFMNQAQDNQIRNRLNEDQAQGKAIRERKELADSKAQQKKEQHKFQYREQTSGPHQNQSGSFGAFSGKGSGGGGGRR